MCDDWTVLPITIGLAIWWLTNKFSAFLFADQHQFRQKNKAGQ